MNAATVTDERLGRQLEGRACLITGAARGMGRAIANMMADRGARAIAILDRDGGADVAEEIAARGVEARVVTCDLRDRDQIYGAVSSTAEAFGGLDVVINNAGVIERTFTNDVDFDTVPEELWDLVMDVNLKAPWLVSRFAAPYLRESPLSPAIVNTASIAGRTAYSHAIYGVSKAAVIQLTRVMATALAPQVRVNCYCPGTVDTDMAATARAAGDVDPRVAAMTATNLLPRLGRPDEIAELVCFLASEQAGFMTGTAVDIDGGALAWRGQRGS